MSEPCRLIFTNVASSRCDLDVYNPKIDGFKESKTIINDVDSALSFESSQEYIIEGVMLTKPQSWITWDIVAEDFYVDDLKK